MKILVLHHPPASFTNGRRPKESLIRELVNSFSPELLESIRNAKTIVSTGLPRTDIFARFLVEKSIVDAGNKNHVTIKNLSGLQIIPIPSLTGGLISEMLYRWMVLVFQNKKKRSTILF